MRRSALLELLGAAPRERDALLEGRERRLERELAGLEARDERLEALERLLEARARSAADPRASAHRRGSYPRGIGRQTAEREKRLEINALRSCWATARGAR